MPQIPSLVRCIVVVGILLALPQNGHAAQEVFAGEITSPSPSSFTAGQSAEVTVRIRSTNGTGNVVIEADSWPNGWTVSPKNRNPTINQGTYYDQTFTVTPPSGGGSGTIVWKLYDDDWGTHPSGSTLLATRNQSVTAQVVTFTDAAIKSGTWVDNDGDGYASALTLEWDAKVNTGTMSVYANLRADDFLSGERDLGNTGNYTLGTSATRKDFAVPVDAKNLNHKTWDFQIDLYKAGTSTRVARLSMGADPQLNDVKLELSSEDVTPQTVTILDASVAGLVDNDGDGFASALTLEWDAKVNTGTMSVYANLRADDFLSGERDLGNTGNYTLGTSATRKDFAVPVDAKNLNHKTWDFQIDLYKAGTSTRVARLAMGADPQLNDVRVELTSEDIPNTAPGAPFYQSNPPTQLYPDVFPVPASGPYTIVVDYTDPNGQDNLQNVYLQLESGSSGNDQTIMWGLTGSPVQWDGEGNHLTSLSASRSSIANGYRVTWSFKLDDGWIPSINVDYDAWAYDDSDVEGQHTHNDRNASYDNGLWVFDARMDLVSDPDMDGFYSELNIEWDADTSLPSRQVYAKVYADDFIHLERYLGQSPVYTIYGQQTEWRSFPIDVDAYDLERATWDFRIELFDAAGNLVSNYTPTDDSDLNNVPVEFSTDEEIPDIVVDDTSLTLTCDGARATAQTRDEDAPVVNGLLALTQAEDPNAIIGHMRVDVSSAGLRDLGGGPDHVILANVPIGGGRTDDFELHRLNVFTTNARIAEFDGTTYRLLNRPQITMFRGHSPSADASLFLAISNNERVFGLAQSDSGTTYIVPTTDRASGELAHLLIPASSLSGWNEDVFCSYDILPENRAVMNSMGQITTNGSDRADELLQVEVLVDMDNDLFSSTFDSDSSAAIGYAANLIGAVTSIYQRDVNVMLSINQLIVWTAPDPFVGEDTKAQLYAYRAYNQAHRDPSVHPEFQRDIAQLLAGDGGGGIAWVDTLCSVNSGYSVSNINGNVTFPPGTGYHWDINVVAHELGHNFGSAHTHCYDPPIDKCYGCEDCDDEENGTCGCDDGSCGNCTGVCYHGTPVSQVGTIMSYCHLINAISLNFGDRVTSVVRAGAENGSCISTALSDGWFTVENRGNASLRIGSFTKPNWLSLYPDAPPEIVVESLATQSIGLSVDCGECSGADLNGVIAIESNDPDQPLVEVHVRLGCAGCGDGTCSADEDPCTCPRDCAGCCDDSGCPDDGNICTDEWCDGSHVCQRTNNTSGCDDGVFCNGVDACANGACVVHFDDPCALGPECNRTCNEHSQGCFDAAGSACGDDSDSQCDLADSCDGAGNCRSNTVDDGTPCDDGNPCMAGEACQDGECAGGNSVNCDAFDAYCADRECDPAGSDGNCDNVTPLNVGLPCNDGQACNVGEACQGGECTGGTPQDCSAAGLECSEASCDPASTEGNCDILTPQNAGMPCDDGQFCTLIDECDGIGTCVGAGESCDFGESCDEVNDRCNPPCDTDDDCTALTDDCNIGVCDLNAGGCNAEPTNANGACDDGDACTEDDTCSNGICVGVREECDDGNACTSDSCDPATGRCQNPPKCPLGQTCDPVTGDCQSTPCQCGPCEGCVAQACVPVVCSACEQCDNNHGCAAIPDCCSSNGMCEPCDECVDNTCEPISCEPGTECDGQHGCVPIPACTNGSDCDDADVCNGEETCDIASGTCQDGAPLNCDDGDLCNGLETCDQALGCQPGTPLECDNHNACDGTETCDPSKGCQSGNSLDCEDSDACNGTESCDPTNGCQPGVPLACDDADLCNGAEFCDASMGCLPGTPLDCDNGLFCDGPETCNPTLGCEEGTAPCPSGVCLENLDTCGCRTSDDCSTGEVCRNSQCQRNPCGVLGFANLAFMFTGFALLRARPGRTTSGRHH
jgi:hypothetical protein